jgi:hypothetical protein
LLERTTASKAHHAGGDHRRLPRPGPLRIAIPPTPRSTFCAVSISSVQVGPGPIRVDVVPIVSQPGGTPTNDQLRAGHPKRRLVNPSLFLTPPLLTVDFGTPSYKFTVNICTYLIF